MKKIGFILFCILNIYSIVGLAIIFSGFGTWTDEDILFQIFRYSFIGLIISGILAFVYFLGDEEEC